MAPVDRLLCRFKFCEEVFVGSAGRVGDRVGEGMGGLVSEVMGGIVGGNVGGLTGDLVGGEVGGGGGLGAHNWQVISMPSSSRKRCGTYKTGSVQAKAETAQWYFPVDGSLQTPV